MNKEEQELESILRKSPEIWEILEKTSDFGMPNWYLSAGCVAQTVWNHKHGYKSHYGIRDYDLIYFDPSDISYEGEDVHIKKGEEVFAHLSAPVEIRNQARVHLWYKEKFGRELAPYKSVEDAISTWPTTSTSIGVRKEGDKVHIFAPHGLSDLFSMTVRANKKDITEDKYIVRVDRWRKLWPNLNIIKW